MGLQVTQSATRYAPGGAGILFQLLPGRIDTDCASFDQTRDSGAAHVSVTQHPVSGIGTAALELDRTDRTTAGVHHVRNLLVRYGDIVISVAVQADDQGATGAYDLAAKVRFIAGRLKLG